MGYKTNSYWIWAFGVSKLNNHELCARLTRGLEVTDLKTIIFVTRSCWGRHADWIIEDAPGGNEGICFKGLGYLSRKLHYWFSLKWKAARKSEFIKKNSLGQSVCILLLPHRLFLTFCICSLSFCIWVDSCKYHYTGCIETFEHVFQIVRF